jgi:hypothetical protein
MKQAFDRHFREIHLKLSAQVAVLRTVVRLNVQPAVSSELSLAAKPVRSLHQREQAGGPNRTSAGGFCAATDTARRREESSTRMDDLRTVQAIG